SRPERSNGVLPTSLGASSCQVCYGGGPRFGEPQWVRASVGICRRTCSRSGAGFRLGGTIANPPQVLPLPLLDSPSKPEHNNLRENSLRSQDWVLRPDRGS